MRLHYCERSLSQLRSWSNYNETVAITLSYNYSARYTHVSSSRPLNRFFKRRGLEMRKNPSATGKIYRTVRQYIFVGKYFVKLSFKCFHPFSEVQVVIHVHSCLRLGSSMPSPKWHHAAQPIHFYGWSVLMTVSSHPQEKEQVKITNGPSGTGVAKCGRAAHWRSLQWGGWQVFYYLDKG